MIYPKKKPKAGFGLDLSQLQLKEGLQENSASLGSAGQLAGGLIKKAGTKDLGYGVSDTSGAASFLGSTVSGAAKGLEMGSSFGLPGAIVGTAVGAGIGQITGAIDAIKNDSESAFRKRDAREMEAVVSRNQEGTSAYNELEQKQVMKDGGEIPDGEDQPQKEEAVILGGKRHKEGGNDIVDETGEKVAETEREEIIFTKEQTEMIERSISLIDSGDKEQYVALGSYVKDIILNRTEDNSGKFKELDNADLPES